MKGRKAAWIDNIPAILIQEKPGAKMKCTLLNLIRRKYNTVEVRNGFQECIPQPKNVSATKKRIVPETNFNLTSQKSSSILIGQNWSTSNDDQIDFIWGTGIRETILNHICRFVKSIWQCNVKCCSKLHRKLDWNTEI